MLELLILNKIFFFKENKIRISKLCEGAMAIKLKFYKF